MSHSRQPVLCPCGRPYRLPDKHTKEGSTQGFVRPGSVSIAVAYRIDDPRQDNMRTVRFCPDCAPIILDMLEERGLPTVQLAPVPEPGDYAQLERRVASHWLHWEQQ